MATMQKLHTHTHIHLLASLPNNMQNMSNNLHNSMQKHMQNMPDDMPKKYAVYIETNESWSNKWFRSCDRNSDFFRDLNLMEVSELNGIVRFIVRSVCKQFGSC